MCPVQLVNGDKKAFAQLSEVRAAGDAANLPPCGGDARQGRGACCPAGVAPMCCNAASIEHRILQGRVPSHPLSVLPDISPEKGGDEVSRKLSPIANVAGLPSPLCHPHPLAAMMRAAWFWGDWHVGN